jgi:hypothetical protein
MKKNKNLDNADDGEAMLTGFKGSEPDVCTSKNVSRTVTERDEDLIPIGSFVTVGNDLGVVVGWPGSPNVPDEHYAIWYGQRAENEVDPLCRTVPVEYCVLAPGGSYVH